MVDRAEGRKARPGPPVLTWTRTFAMPTGRVRHRSIRTTAVGSAHDPVFHAFGCWLVRPQTQSL